MKTGARGRFYVSAHALDRYVERFRPHLSREDALAEMISITDRAERVRRFDDGHELWRGPKDAPVPRLLFLVAPLSEGELPVVCTVPERKRQAPKPDNHRARRRAERKAAFRARFLGDSPPASDA